jgi:Ca2+-binding EF-hand superfamily protein
MADKEEKKEDQIVEEKANEEVVDEEEDEESEEVDDLDLLCEAITSKLNMTDPEEIDDELLEESLTGYNNILEIDHECIEALKGKGYVLGLLDDFPQAKEVLMQAKALAPNDTGIDDMIQQCSVLEEEYAQENGASVPDLVEKGEPTEKFVQALEEIFARFDKDGDGGWSDDEFDQYHRFVNGTPISPTVVINFKREYGTTDSGAFSLDGFVTFYVEQTIDDAEETWKDLTKLGYNKKLERSEK